VLEIVRDISSKQESLLKSASSDSIGDNHVALRELKSLRAQVKGMEILMGQNAALEREVYFVLINAPYY
jgi:hypothetical protein